MVEKEKKNKETGKWSGVPLTESEISCGSEFLR